MAKEYWYLAGTQAEGEYTCYVHLTKAERKAVEKFLNQLDSGEHCVCSEDWCGSVWCDEETANVDFEISE